MDRGWPETGARGCDTPDLTRFTRRARGSDSSDPSDARLTIDALRDARILNRVHVVEDGAQALAFLRREGKDVTIVAYSGMAINGAQACETLATEHGIDAELIDLRTIVPLDFEAIARSVAKTRRAVICHEGWVSGGVGAEISARITEELFGDLLAPVERVGAKNAHIPFAPVLEVAHLPTTAKLVAAIRQTLAF